MNPSLSFAQVRRNHHNNTGFSYGVIEMKDLYFMLDAVRIVEKGGFLNEKEQAGLRKWFSDYMDWLEMSAIILRLY
ncbi:MAG: alginate lyase family protein, partial [Bacteroidota bacterium]